MLQEAFEEELKTYSAQADIELIVDFLYGLYITLCNSAQTPTNQDSIKKLKGLLIRLGKEELFKNEH